MLLVGAEGLHPGIFNYRHVCHSGDVSFHEDIELKIGFDVFEAFVAAHSERQWTYCNDENMRSHVLTSHLPLRRRVVHDCAILRGSC